MNDTVVEPVAAAVAAFLGLIETTNQVVKSVEFVELVGSMIAVVAATAEAKQTES